MASGKLINGKTLLDLAPIEGMLDHTAYFKGTSYGLTELGYDIRVKEDVHLDPSKHNGRFALPSAIEYFHMPLSLAGRVCDKSTWARKGVAVQNTYIKPSWRGYLTLELSYFKDDPIFIPAGSGIAQVIFEEPLEKIPYTGIYQDQEMGPQEARMHPDDESRVDKAEGYYKALCEAIVAIPDAYIGVCSGRNSKYRDVYVADLTRNVLTSLRSRTGISDIGLGFDLYGTISSLLDIPDQYRYMWNVSMDTLIGESYLYKAARLLNWIDSYSFHSKQDSLFGNEDRHLASARTKGNDLVLDNLLYPLRIKALKCWADDPTENAMVVSSKMSAASISLAEDIIRKKNEKECKEG